MMKIVNLFKKTEKLEEVKAIFKDLWKWFYTTDKEVFVVNSQGFTGVGSTLIKTLERKLVKEVLGKVEVND